MLVPEFRRLLSPLVIADCFDKHSRNAFRLPRKPHVNFCNGSASSLTECIPP